MPTRAKTDVNKRLLNLQLIRAILYIGGAAALVVMLRSVTQPVNASYVTADALASQTQTVFVPAMHSVLDAPIGVLAGAALLIAGLFAVYRYTKGQNVYKKEVKQGVSGLKWVDLGLSSALIITVVSLMTGLSDPVVIKVIAGVTGLACYFGWLVEKQNEKTAKKADWTAFIGGILVGVLAWLPILSTLLFTWFYGAVRLPWYSYALAVSVALGFVLVSKNQLLHLKAYKTWKDNAVVERNYLLIDLATKLAFAVILIVGLRG